MENGVETRRLSGLYKTEPWGIEDQDWFVNAVCEVRTSLDVRKLLAVIGKIESQMGRIRKEKWGPRLIDIDILEFNKMKIQSEKLTLPHPYYPERSFVLLPFADLAPNWIPTGTNQPIRELINLLDDENLPVLVSE
ncbi:UNVERIFIED_CONTAM: hypothetical protein GTU68_043520 [Idotea baltica]|nr:hypothetical protein [Idotea baltica]